MTERRTFAPGDFLTVPQALEILPVGRSTLYNLVETGALPSFRVSAAGSRRGRVLISRADLEAFIAESRQTATRAPVRLDADAVLERVRQRREGG